MSDNVNHPEHYTFGDIECFDAMKAQMSPEEFRGYLRGCAIKYIWRFQHKGGVLDLEKAVAYLQRLIQKLKEAEHD